MPSSALLRQEAIVPLNGILVIAKKKKNKHQFLSSECFQTQVTSFSEKTLLPPLRIRVPVLHGQLPFWDEGLQGQTF